MCSKREAPLVIVLAQVYVGDTYSPSGRKSRKIGHGRYTTPLSTTTAPPEGYDSVTAQGVFDAHHREVVVYSGVAAVPVYMVDLAAVRET